MTSGRGTISEATLVTIASPVAVAPLAPKSKSSVRSRSVSPPPALSTTLLSLGVLICLFQISNANVGRRGDDPKEPRRSDLRPSTTPLPTPTTTTIPPTTGPSSTSTATLLQQRQVGRLFPATTTTTGSKGLDADVTPSRRPGFVVVVVQLVLLKRSCGISGWADRVVGARIFLSFTFFWGWMRTFLFWRHRLVGGERVFLVSFEKRSEKKAEAEERSDDPLTGHSNTPSAHGFLFCSFNDGGGIATRRLPAVHMLLLRSSYPLRRQSSDCRTRMRVLQCQNRRFCEMRMRNRTIARPWRSVVVVVVTGEVDDGTLLRLRLRLRRGSRPRFDGIEERLEREGVGRS